MEDFLVYSTNKSNENESTRSISKVVLYFYSSEQFSKKNACKLGLGGRKCIHGGHTKGLVSSHFGPSHYSKRCSKTSLWGLIKK